MWFDTHTHLFTQPLAAHAHTLVPQLRASAISELIDIPLCADDWPSHLSQASQIPDPHIYLALGYHPLYLPGCLAPAMLRLSEFCTDYPQRVIAIGEIGLDFYSGRHHANQQIAWLEAQFALAVDLGLPVILHVRKAHEEVLSLLKAFPKLWGVCHGFSGAPELADHYISLGFKLGIGGQVTFENAHRLHRTVRALPLTAFLLETDAPWMPPSGYNGAMNTPLTLLIVSQTVARLKGLTLDEVALQTTLNSHEVFKR